jgi:hypothetical protein
MKGVARGAALLLLCAVAPAGANVRATPSRAAPTRWVDLSRAVVVVSPKAGPVERKAAQLLVEESARRSGLTLPVRASLPAAGGQRPWIALGSAGHPPPGGDPLAPTRLPKDSLRRRRPEAYVIIVARRGATARVTALGADPRGCMFAAGRLLRFLRLAPGRIGAPVMEARSAPAKPLRGHQLGWRPTSNTYDRWGLKEYEQYVRDLVVWGTNAIELIPEEPGTEPERNVEFNARLADLIHSYGLQVWLWYPIDDRAPPGAAGDGLTSGQTACPSRPDGRSFILARRRALFRRFRYVDAVFIPGGDPGGCECERCRPWERTLLPLARDIAAILRRNHPRAQVWLSNQGFEDADNRHLYAWLRSEQPPWLTGLVYAPWAHETAASMRERTPPRYPIRLYPDVTHTVRCQFPARDWDQAFALTLDREPPIYRPSDQAHIARLFQPITCGAITYSDGVNDDLNKVIWSARLWDPGADLDRLMREYGRYYFGEECAGPAAAGLRKLERNGIGPLLGNRAVRDTFDFWTGLETRARPSLRSSWRFNMALLRAYYDRYVQLRLEHDTAVEQDVYRALEAGEARAGITGALALLDQSDFRAPALRGRLLELGQVLYDQIGMQLSVARWGASGDERGAILDHLDTRLANLDWLGAELRNLSGVADPAQVADGIRRIVHWDDPGPGGFYDDLGNPSRQPHLLRPRRWEDDPGYLESPRVDFRIPIRNGRQSWNHYAEALYNCPITLQYDGLDPLASYVVRATYCGRYHPTMTLTANGTYPIHGPVATSDPPVTGEWSVPRASTGGGRLTLTWTRVSGRGAQVSEVWLMRVTSPPATVLLTFPLWTASHVRPLPTASAPT